MKKTLLSKLAKGASVALLASVMVCGASLTNVNASAKPNKDAQAEKAMTTTGLGAIRKTSKHAKKTVRKSTKRVNKKGIRKNAKKASNKKARKHVAKKSVKRNKKVAKRSNRKAMKRYEARRATKRAAIRRAKIAKRDARRALRRRAVKPMNRRAYRYNQRALKNFRHSRYYHEIWSRAEKINVRAVNWNKAKINKLYRANGSKRLTKYEHRALNRDIKAVQKHTAYMQKYVNHDAYMLGLAK